MKFYNKMIFRHGLYYVFIVFAWVMVCGSSLAFVDKDLDYERFETGRDWGMPEVLAGDKSMPAELVLEQISSRGDFSSPEELNLDFDFPLVYNERVEFYINYFAKRGHAGFGRWLSRLEVYGPRIREILRQEGMPEDFIYLAMIESGFNPHAISHAGAGGMWQFMPATGRKYGLKINYWIDERFDPEKSTRAAVAYLKDLYKMFGCWHLAAASYNCGEGRVMRLMKKYQTNDYWAIRDEKGLMLETKDYLPKIIAAAFIAKNPERFGFTNLKQLDPFVYDSIMLEQATDLRLVASLSGTGYQVIKKLNPELKHWCTPPGYKAYEVHIPVNSGKAFTKAYAKLDKNDLLKFRKHKVGEGESVSQIAAGYGTGKSIILSMNGMRSSKYLKAGQVLTLPVPSDRSPNRSAMNRVARQEKRVRSYPAHPPSAKEMAAKGLKKVNYILESGDSLWSVSRVSGVPVSLIQSWNGIKDPRSLRAGYVINLYIPESHAKTLPAERLAKGDIKTHNSKPYSGPMLDIHYVIKSGDSLWSIARAYDIHVADIRKLNDLPQKFILQPGDSLKLKVPEHLADAESVKLPRAKPVSGPAQPRITKTVSYVVKAGDSLWTIARAHDLRVAEVRSLNGLADDHILRPGDSLKLEVDKNLKVASAPAAPAAPRKLKLSNIPRQDTPYNVQQGDTLWSIARRYGVHVSEILTWNKLPEGHILHPGETLILKLPATK